MYLEFERNDAFIPLRSDLEREALNSNVWAFKAVPNFNQTIEFDVWLNHSESNGFCAFNGQPAELILRGFGDNVCVVGINLTDQGGYSFHSKAYPDGNLATKLNKHAVRKP